MKTITLVLRTYKIPITINSDKEIIETTVDLTEDMITKTEEIELKPETDNIQLKIPEISKKVHNYNERQRKSSLVLEKDYILKQIVTRKY